MSYIKWLMIGVIIICFLYCDLQAWMDDQGRRVMVAYQECLPRVSLDPRVTVAALDYLDSLDLWDPKAKTDYLDYLVGQIEGDLRGNIVN